MSKKYSVSQECVAMVTELTLRQSEILANDLECFSRHAKRCEPYFSQKQLPHKMKWCLVIIITKSAQAIFSGSYFCDHCSCIT